MPDVSRVVGGGEPCPIEASVVGGDGSDFTFFDLEDNGVVLPNRTIDGFGTIDEACCIKVVSVKAEVIDSRPTWALPKYGVVFPNTGKNARGNDGTTCIYVACSIVNGQGIKVANGAAVDAVFIENLAVLPNLVVACCRPTVVVEHNPLDERLGTGRE